MGIWLSGGCFVVGLFVLVNLLFMFVKLYFVIGLCSGLVIVSRFLRMNR